MRPDFLAVIPARGGSKGLPRKNVRMICGKPLIAWTIEASLGAGYISRTVVSTEDPEIASIARDYGAEVINRPKELAQDATLISPVLVHAVNHLIDTEGYKPYAVVLLNPTSPLRGSDYIDLGCMSLLRCDADCAISVTLGQVCLWQISTDGYGIANYDFQKKPRRQEAPKQYLENGAIYITKTDYLLENNNFLGGKVRLFAMPYYNAVDIDTAIDFRIAELLLNEATTNESKIKGD